MKLWLDRPLNIRSVWTEEAINSALKPIDREHAIRVVYEEVNDNIVVITFYPVKRERFNV